MNVNSINIKIVLQAMDSNESMGVVWFLSDQWFRCSVEEVQGLVEPYGTFACTEMIPNDACMIWGADDDAQEADMDAGLDAGR